MKIQRGHSAKNPALQERKRKRMQSRAEIATNYYQAICNASFKGYYGVGNLYSLCALRLNKLHLNQFSSEIINKL